MYDTKVKPQHERVAVIAGLDTPKAKKVENWFVHEGKSEMLSVITVPIDVPLYRMANGRTQVAQMAYVAASGQDPSFFSSHEEGVAAQKEQHKILAKLAEDGTDSIIPILQELARTGQTDPILITPAGVVVNGNRRLAAMRELYSSGKHPNFADIRCEVLPTLTPEQLDDVEDRLQMRPETKLPYTWINDALRVEKRLISKKEDQVSRLMRREKGEIKRAVAALNLARIYLKDWCKSPYDYERVAEGQQFFFDLANRIKGNEGALKEANMRIAWMLFDNRESLGSRIYNFNKALGNEEVADRLKERIEIEEPSDEEGDSAPPQGTEDQDELEVDFGGDSASPYDALVKALDDESRRAEIIEDVISVCQTVVDSGKAKATGQSALIAARDANTRLTELDLAKADPKTWDAIDKQLDAVSTRVAELKAKLQDIRKKASGKTSAT